MSAEINSIEAISQRVREAQQSGNKVVFTNGCFDILHAGHIEFLRAARALGDCLVVAVNSDASVSRVKAPNRPIIPQEERTELLAGLEMVDFVCVFEDDTPLQTILKIHPDILVKGADWQLEDIVGRSQVESWGGIVQALPLVPDKSTTDVVMRVLDRYGNPGKKNS